MSVNVEWMDSPSVRFAPSGTVMPDGQETDTDALVISADSVLVVEGDIEGFLDAVRAAVTNPSLDRRW